MTSKSTSLECDCISIERLRYIELIESFPVKELQGERMRGMPFYDFQMMASGERLKSNMRIVALNINCDFAERRASQLGIKQCFERGVSDN